MKLTVKITILTIVLVLLSSGCTKKTVSMAEEAQLEAGIVFETTRTGELSFYMAGNNPVTIEWKDGKEEFNLQKGTSWDVIWINRRDCRITLRTQNDFGRVVISGEGITHFQAGIEEMANLPTQLLPLDATKIDLTKSPDLAWIIIEDNLLTSLDLSQNTALQVLDLRGNQITNLDLRNNSALKHLNVDNNQLTSLVLGNHPELYYISAAHNMIKTLDLSHTPALLNLYVNDNKITSLDLNKKTLLTNLNLSHNQMKRFNLSNLDELYDVLVTNNRLSASEINNLFRSLSAVATEREKILLFGENPGANLEQIDVSIATDRGWLVGPDYANMFAPSWPDMATKAAGFGFFNDVKLLESMTDDEGLMTLFAYDKQNRLARFVYKGHGANEAFTIVYKDGIPAEMNSDTKSHKKVYHKKDNMITVETIEHDESIDTITYILNSDDQIIEIMKTNLHIEFIYSNGNITKMIDHDDGETRLIEEYTHDDQKSPFHNTNTPRWLLYDLFFWGLNTNNVTNEYRYGNLERRNKFEYDDDGFPTTSLLNDEYPSIYTYKRDK